MRKENVTCDHCGKDLTTTGNCEDWRIVVGDEAIPGRGGCVTLMAIQPALGGTFHFCHLRCFATWTLKKYGSYVATDKATGATNASSD